MINLLLPIANAAFLAAASYFDIKKRIIPNKIVIFMLIACMLYADFLVLSGLLSENVMMHLFKAVAGAGIALIFMMIPGMVTGKSFGAGDKKVFAVLGLSQGPWRVTVLMGLAMVSAAMFIFLKWKKKDNVAMAPHILMAYISVAVIFEVLPVKII